MAAKYAPINSARAESAPFPFPRTPQGSRGAGRSKRERIFTAAPTRLRRIGGQDQEPAGSWRGDSPSEADKRR